jgi:hypothetical protein
MKLIAVLALALGSVLVTPVLAQKTSGEANMQILRDKIKADKKLVVAANLDLTDAEAKKFWPIYESHQKTLAGLNQRIAKAILEYAAADEKGTMTDVLAKKLIKESNAIDLAMAKARKAVTSKLAPVLPGRKLARYIQIENKIRAAINYELASEIPLVQ